MEKDIYGYVLNKLTPNPYDISEEEKEKMIKFLEKYNKQFDEIE